MESAIEGFRTLESGILNIIRAADIYAVHVIHKMRGRSIPHETIEAILDHKKVSGFNVLGVTYTPEELQRLREEGHFREIGQQILVATHTALEGYLKNKFEEYYRFRLRGVDEVVISQSLKRFNFRSLNNIEKAYKDVLRIHLRFFEIDYYTSEGCNFQPGSCWKALQLIDSARHEIVHRGESETYTISSLMDSWYPFEFTRGWVDLFDANFDGYLYQGMETPLIQEYRQRADSAGIVI